MPEYRNPTPTADILIVRDNSVVLVKRRNPPHGWAIPGGFVDEGECVEAAAIREAKEETGLDVVLEELFDVYSDPARDARLHTLSVIFIAHAKGDPLGADDAEEARYFDLNALPEPLCFDHATILDDYKHYAATGKRRQIARFNQML
ncbi:MAG: NUDIX hydrolase [Proteobacteria bacterium]|nr:NUDIX hydrolase [Pseudomonadota bacterium]